ncbi:MAG: right-handed parallel beta-helix repeat-containing protein, partial [Armatimonadetes bacterium]|nr:right-handed parallel beta-helix repeat-containing protein [Armatimonadota bacterium]
AACLAAVMPAALAATLYVATNGNDAWSGRMAKPNGSRTAGPLATLTGAREAIRKLKATGLSEPVQVMISGGPYRLTSPLVLQPQDSGTAECPVTYCAAPGSRPVISGGRVIKGWRQQAKGLWVADLPEALEGKLAFRSLFVNGQRRTLARSPNEGFYYIASKAALVTDPQTGKETDPANLAFRFRPGEIKAWDNLNDIDAVIYFHWESGMLRLKSVDEVAQTVTFTGPMKWPFWSKQRYFVENFPEALDAPGEWYLDRYAGKLYYRPMPGENMTKAQVVAPVVTQLVLFQGEPEAGMWVEHVRFEGLSFQHADYTLEPEGHGDWQAAVTIPAVIQARGAKDCSLEGCEIAHVGQYGVWFSWGCKNNRVVQCHLHDLGAGGVRIGEGGIPPNEALQTSGNVVDNNLIHDGGILFPGAVGVWIGQSCDNQVSHNEICDMNYTAISCGWTWGFGPTWAFRNRIEFNHLHHLMRGVLSDGAAIYTLGTSPGTVVRNNLIHDVWCFAEGYGAGGIYPDEGSSQILIENNVVYRTLSGGLTVHYGRDDIARNNIFALGRDGQVYLGRQDMNSSLTFERNIVYYTEGTLFTRDSKLTADNNVYWNASGEPVTFLNEESLEDWRKRGVDEHAVIADPLFVDPKNGDFRLKPDSPALKLGFQPIDVSQAGLYGASSWTNLPKTIKRPPTAFPARPEVKPQLIDDGFENSPVGATAEGCITWGEAGGGTIRVTDQVAASGKHGLKFTDVPGLDQPWNPHLWYNPYLTEGMVNLVFDLRFEKGAAIWHEWRDAASPYRVAASIGIDSSGQLLANQQPVMPLPADQWIHFEIECGMGKQATGTYTLVVTVPGQEPKRIENLPCNPKCIHLDWLGFISNATEHAVFYLDNVKLTGKGK